MNKIEDSKEQVPDMVYKDLIEAFAKARVTEVKTPDGYYVRMKLLKTKVCAEWETQDVCACNHCKCPDDIDEYEDPCEWCQKDLHGEHCMKCQKPLVYNIVKEKTVYISKSHSHFESRAEFVPRVGDWSESLKQFLNHDPIMGEPVTFRDGTVYFQSCGANCKDHTHVKVKQRGRTKNIPMIIKPYTLIGIVDMSPVYK